MSKIAGIVSAMNELNRFHELTNCGRSREQIIADYRDYVLDELRELQEARTSPSIVKEICDVIVVCQPLINVGSQHDKDLHQKLQESMKQFIASHGINWWNALSKVNDSNMSKFIFDNEIEHADQHFNKMGIQVVIEPVDEELYGCFSNKDQEVNGKSYPAGKLLKPHSYYELDESIEWWL